MLSSYLYNTPCLKNVLPLACYKSDTCERVLIFFGSNVTDKVSNQKTLHYATSTCASTLPGKTEKRENCIFPQCCSVLPMNSTSCLISSIFLTHDSYSRCLLYDSLSLVINAFNYREYWGHNSGERKCCSSWTVLHVQCTSAPCLLFFISQGNAEALDK